MGRGDSAWLTIPLDFVFAASMHRTFREGPLTRGTDLVPPLSRAVEHPLPADLNVTRARIEALRMG
jgi:hypothetical protein